MNAIDKMNDGLYGAERPVFLILLLLAGAINRLLQRNRPVFNAADVLRAAAFSSFSPFDKIAPLRQIREADISSLNKMQIYIGGLSLVLWETYIFMIQLYILLSHV